MPPPTPARPTLSVVVPVLDDAPALRRCLAALDAQSLAPLEVVVVDNGCRDDSVAVALEHGARVVVEPQRGIPAAAATGYDAATGDVVVRCDADTLAPPDWLERIADAFADPGLDALTGDGDFYDLGAAGPFLARLYLGAYYASMHGALAHPPLWGSNMAVRRSAWLAVRDRVVRTDPELHDDVDLAFCLGPMARIRRDRSLRVGVSGRSLRGAGQVRRRFVRGLRTVAVHRPTTPAWRRWEARWRGTGPAAVRPGLRSGGEPG
ncbi:glycosyltransferase family 2 protein [Actinotalea sp. AC32]|nr:glycosyltransferase family 2 protein [Actinotalea sp. AC32]